MESFLSGITIALSSDVDRFVSGLSFLLFNSSFSYSVLIGSFQHHHSLLPYLMSNLLSQKILFDLDDWGTSPVDVLSKYWQVWLVVICSSRGQYLFIREKYLASHVFSLWKPSCFIMLSLLSSLDGSGTVYDFTKCLTSPLIGVFGSCNLRIFDCNQLMSSSNDMLFEMGFKLKIELRKFEIVCSSSSTCDT